MIHVCVLCFSTKTVKHNKTSGRRERDRMVVGFSTTCANSAYHH